MGSSNGITIEQRQALRRRFRNHQLQHRTKLSQKQLIQWFEATYGRKLTQGAVSQSLSARYAHLDQVVNEPPVREGQWPDLERILLMWQLSVEAKGGSTMGPMLKAKAKDIWRQLPQYSGKEEPQFSDGWLTRFKARYHIQHYRQHGEGAAVPASAESEMAEIRKKVAGYAKENVYNMDETGLFWRMAPNQGLATKRQPGIKRDKSRISLVMCTNATGTDRLRVWVIGNAKKPRSLRYVNVAGMRITWKWNKKAWMTCPIMAEWLRAFYEHVGSERQVVLTMDNFSAHLTALNESPPPPNVKIIFLPANSTSKYQPLDQGIIQNFKTFYRKAWVNFMTKEWSDGRDPMKTVDLAACLRWTTSSWESVTPITISNCFAKSTLLEGELVQEPSPVTELKDSLSQARHLANFPEDFNLEAFVNPPEEDMLDDQTTGPQDPDALVQELIEHEVEKHSPDDPQEPEQQQPSHTLKEIVHMIQCSMDCLERRQHDLVEDALVTLRKAERIVQKIASTSTTQSTVDNFVRTTL